MLTVSSFLFILMVLVGGAETPRAVTGCIGMKNPNIKESILLTPSEASCTNVKA